MTVKDLLKRPGYENMYIVLSDYYAGKFIVYTSYKKMRAEYKNRIVSDYDVLPDGGAGTLWVGLASPDEIQLKAPLHTYRLVILSGSNGRQPYPETYEWEAEYLTRSALNRCINRLYSRASLDEYIVYGYLQHIEDGWYVDTIAEIRASTWPHVWPDRIASTHIYINNRYIKTMGGRGIK